ncbi:MAG TPA: hypothetical protein PKW55_08125 [Spirochaetota bacterium]|nr:hypothetical protein [Spirochaetota bacterium]HOM38792.1 hypothetical protein [Spirochaetota bacterium]HPQ49850.1 hypothetical protein [Spirochaetota bacterium]
MKKLIPYFLLLSILFIKTYHLFSYSIKSISIIQDKVSFYSKYNYEDNNDENSNEDDEDNNEDDDID